MEPIWDEADCELVDSAPTLRRSGVRLKTAGGPNFMAVDALRGLSEKIDKIYLQQKENNDILITIKTERKHFYDGFVSVLRAIKCCCRG